MNANQLQQQECQTNIIECKAQMLKALKNPELNRTTLLKLFGNLIDTMFDCELKMIELRAEDGELEESEANELAKKIQERAEMKTIELLF